MVFGREDCPVCFVMVKTLEHYIGPFNNFLQSVEREITISPSQHGLSHGAMSRVTRAYGRAAEVLHRFESDYLRGEIVDREYSEVRMAMKKSLDDAYNNLHEVRRIQSSNRDHVQVAEVPA